MANDLEDSHNAEVTAGPKRDPQGSSGSARVRLPVTPTILKVVWAGRATDYEMILFGVLYSLFWVFQIGRITRAIIAAVQ